MRSGCIYTARESAGENSLISFLLIRLFFFHFFQISFLLVPFSQSPFSLSLLFLSLPVTGILPSSLSFFLSIEGFPTSFYFTVVTLPSSVSSFLLRRRKHFSFLVLFRLSYFFLFRCLFLSSLLHVSSCHLRHQSILLVLSSAFLLSFLSLVLTPFLVSSGALHILSSLLSRRRLFGERVCSSYLVYIHLSILKRRFTLLSAFGSPLSAISLSIHLSISCFHSLPLSSFS